MLFDSKAHGLFTTLFGPLLVVASTACTPAIEYGPAEPLTSEQREAVEVLSEVMMAAHAAVEGEANPHQLFVVHPLMIELQSLAVLAASPISGKGVVPPGIDPDCVEGSRAEGLRYVACATDRGTINGEIRFTLTHVSYDLRINSGDGGRNWFNVLGELDVHDGRVLGVVELRTHVEVPDHPSVAGIEVGDEFGDVNATTLWDVRLSPERGCIVDGTVDVEVEARGQTHATRYPFTGCDRVPSVHNGEL